MKNIFTLLLFITLISSHGQTIGDGLLLHYPISGDANDISGNDFHGITNATLTADRYGNSNAAYSFNGVDEYIDFPNVSELEPELPVTIALWVRFDNFEATKSTVFTTDFAQNNHSGIWMNTTSTGTLSISYGDATGNTTSSNRRTKHGTFELETDIWYHIVTIFKGPYDMDIYIDCNYDDGDYFGSGGDLGYTSNQGSIGRKDAHTSYPAYYFDGAIDDFQYWNRELSEAEVMTLCKNNISTQEEANTSAIEIFVFPNPTNDILHIKADKEIEYEKVMLRNAIGQIVYEETFQTEINIDFLKSGIYYLQVINSDKETSKTVKLVKL